MVWDVLPVLYPVNQDDNLPVRFHPFKLHHIVHAPIDRVHPAEFHNTVDLVRFNPVPVQVPCAADRIDMAVADMVPVKHPLNFPDGLILINVSVLRDRDVKHTFCDFAPFLPSVNPFLDDFCPFPHGCVLLCLFQFCPCLPMHRWMDAIMESCSFPSTPMLSSASLVPQSGQICVLPSARETAGLPW